MPVGFRYANNPDLGLITTQLRFAGEARLEDER
jgi:hypothetical protein